MLKGFFAILNLIANALMLLSASAAYINPNSVWQFSFAGILFMPLMITNLAFVILWLIARKWLVLLPVAALLICYKSVLLTFGLNFGTQQEKGVKILVWNVRNFDLYNWSKNLETRAEVMQLIEAEDADILCLQEFYTDSGTLMNNIKYLADTLGYSFYHFEPTVEVNRYHNRKKIEQKWGEATFSKFPIVNRSRVDFTNSQSNDCIYTDILVSGDTLRVYNMHLQSIHLDNNDYSAIQEMEEKQEPDWKNIRKIVSKMKNGSRSRASQAEQVARSIRKFKGKQIVCGDFNDVPVSYTYNKLANANDMQDAFVAKGFAFGKTFINPYLYLRIDNVLASKNIHINSWRTNQKVLSDHYAVCVSFNF